MNGLNAHGKSVINALAKRAAAEDGDEKLRALEELVKMAEGKRASRKQDLTTAFAQS